MYHTVDPTLQRVADAIPGQRASLQLSLNQLARCSRVSRGTIRRIERGQQVDPALLLRVAGALTTLELYSPSEDDLLGDLHPERLLVAPARPPLQPAPTPTLGGAA